MSLQAILHAVNRTINPFYNNPIVSIADPEHLEGDRVVLRDPHLQVHAIARILMDHPHVYDALLELDGPLVLKCVVTKDSIRVNVFETTGQPSLEEQQAGFKPLDTRGWPMEGVYYLTVEETAKGHQRGYVSLATEGVFHHFHFDPSMPEQSWTVPLSYLDRVLLQFVR